MKTMINKLLSATLAVSLAALGAGCSGQTGAASSSQPASSASSASSASEATSQAASSAEPQSPSVKVGVIQFAAHPSLDNCYTGLRQGLEEAGFIDGQNMTIDFQNAQNDMGNSDMMAKGMVTQKYDLLVGIATPSAMSAYAAAKDSDIPVVFTAVSDAVAAGIVKSNEKPEVNCTGSSDVLPLEQQVEMIRGFLPEAKKIGVIYTTSEPNSVSQLKRLEEIGAAKGFEIVSVGVTNASEVAAAATTVVSKGADCINNFTDNNVVDNLTAVLRAAEKGNIPVFGSEIEQVKNGCLASQGIDYVALGRETGKMAAGILKGEAKAAETPVFMVKDCSPVYNPTVLETLGLTLPEAYKDAESVGK